MSIFSTLTTDDSIANETDSVGGGSRILESNLYPCTVSMAYTTKSAGGAGGLVLTLATPDKREIKQTLWVTSGTAKGGSNFYTDKNGERKGLPGFIHANALALLTCGKEISAIPAETKVVKVYSPEAKAEVPTKVEVLTDLLGKEILVGLIKQTVDKTAKNDAGVYLPTGDVREENEIDKFFRASDRMTTHEIRDQYKEAEFVQTWADKWAGKTRNKAKGEAANAGTFGAPKAAAGGTKKPSSSLFG